MAKSKLQVVFMRVDQPETARKVVEALAASGIKVEYIDTVDMSRLVVKRKRKAAPRQN